MNISIKKFLVTISIFILITIIYLLFIQQEENIRSDDSIYQLDYISPLINTISGDMQGIAGKSASINVTFSDKIEVTTAQIFYKPASALHWSSKSILNGNAEIELPPFSNESWYYYLIVNDIAGNGPIGNPSVDGTIYYIITVIIPLPDNSNENENYFKPENISRSVFVEIGTKIVCSECPKISRLIQELYQSNEYAFYYVTLPIDNPKAAEYLGQYNIWGYPTVFIDGGYEIAIGSTVDKATFQKKITAAANRTKPDIQAFTQARWNNDSQKIQINIDLRNNEQTKYSGQLRVYLTEIVSKKWQGGTPEHFSFLSFVINEPIKLEGYENQTITKTIDASDLDPENLMIFSVVTNIEYHTQYSQPPDKNEFEAHYVDGVYATAVIQGGNLPPEVGIENPSVKYFHLFGNPIRKSITAKTILIGKTYIVAYARDDSTITKVEFYIDNNLMFTVFQEPYECLWKSFAIGRKTITVKAYDDTGKTSTASIDLVVFIKWPGVLSRIKMN